MDCFLKFVELPEALYVSVGCMRKTILLSESVFRDFISDCPKLVHLGLRCVALNRSPDPQNMLREAAFKSLIEHLPKGLQSLTAVCQRDAETHAISLEYTFIVKAMQGDEQVINALPLGLRVITLCETGLEVAPAPPVTYGLEYSERTLKLVFAPVEKRAAEREFYGDMVTSTRPSNA